MVLVIYFKRRNICSKSVQRHEYLLNFLFKWTYYIIHFNLTTKELRLTYFPKPMVLYLQHKFFYPILYIKKIIYLIDWGLKLSKHSLLFFMSTRNIKLICYRWLLCQQQTKSSLDLNPVEWIFVFRGKPCCKKMQS